MGEEDDVEEEEEEERFSSRYFQHPVSFIPRPPQQDAILQKYSARYRA